MECITTASYSVSLNGSSHGFFHGKRRIRQGDPLSPYIFVLALEYLSRLIKIKTRDPNFNYHPKCEKIGFTHLVFADDIMFIVRGDSESIRIICNTLHQFGSISGLHINHAKSRIFAAGITEEKFSDLQDISNIPRGEFPVKYLGIPLMHGKHKTTYFTPLLHRISSKIREWTSSSLSYAGKLELIKAILQGIEAFWIHAFPFPTTIIRSINSMGRTYANQKLREDLD